MKGSIRGLLGLVVLMGVAGGMDTATDTQLPALILIAILGLFVMASGVKEMKYVR